MNILSVSFLHEKHADRPLYFSAVLPASISSCLALGHRIACVTLLLWQASPTWRGRLVATYSSSGTTHTYIYRLLCFFIYFGRGAERLCVWPVFCSRRGTRPAAQSPSETAAGFSELSKLELPSSFQSFVFLCFQVKWTEEILSLLISGTQNHGFKPRAKTPQVQFHIKAEKAILFCHVTLPKKAYIMLKCYLYSCHRRYNINN